MESIQPPAPAPPERWQGQRSRPPLRVQPKDEEKDGEEDPPREPRAPRGEGRLDILA